MPRGALRIGTSGWEYDHWVGPLYSQGLPRAQWFGRFAEIFDTVEVNNTFYNLPGASTFDRWREQAPEGFLYALKFSRYGTHMKKLKDPEGPIGKFLDVAERLDAHLGPILVQLPPKWRADPERLDAFLKAAPKRRRWAIEFRDPSWLTDGVFDILRAHGAALVIHDMLDDHPREMTADWVYLRYHADHYQGAYSHQFLTAEAQRFADWLRDDVDVYVYFNNDEAGHAVRNAQELRRYVEHALGSRATTGSGGPPCSAGECGEAL